MQRVKHQTKQGGEGVYVIGNAYLKEEDFEKMINTINSYLRQHELTIGAAKAILEQCIEKLDDEPL